MSGEKIEYLRTVEKLAAHVDVMVMAHAHIPTSHFYHNHTLFTGHLGNLFFPMHMTKLGKCKILKSFISNLWLSRFVFLFAVNQKPFFYSITLSKRRNPC